jgi:hypothetical protein
LGRGDGYGVVGGEVGWRGRFFGCHFIVVQKGDWVGPVVGEMLFSVVGSCE